MASTPPPPPASPARARPLWLTTLALIVGPAVVAFVLVVGGGWWLWTTTAGLRATALVLSTFMPGITITGVEGSLASGFSVATFAVRLADTAVIIDDLAVEPKKDWTPFAARFEVERLAAHRVQIEWVSKPSTGKPPPESIGIPIDVRVTQARIGELAIGARDATPLVFRAVEFAGQANAETIDLARISGEFGRARAQGRVRLGALPPFTTDVEFELGTEWQERPVQAHLVATGSLHRLQLDLRSDDAVARARVSATLRVFDPVLVARLVADIDAFDPTVWLTDAPSMQLRAHADLSPIDRPGQALAIAGPFEVENRIPGAIDRDRVPLRSVQGTLTWAEDRLALVIARAEGMKGTASGELTWSSADGLAARLQFAGIDLEDLHSRAVPTRATGEFGYSVRNGEQRFSANARNTRGLALSAEAEATLRAQVLEVSKAQLRLGEGRADLRGRLELQGQRALQVAGSFSALDLAQAVRGVDTRLNGRFEVRGRLQTPLTGQLNFALSDSRIAGRPVSGRGLVTLAGRHFDADVDIQSATGRLVAAGGLGGGRELRLDLDAPDIESLLPGYRGRLTARVTLKGELEALRLTGSVDGADFVLPGDHRIERVEASFSGGQAASDPLALSVQVTGHTHPAGPDMSVARASLIGRGTTSGASFELNAATLAGQRARVLAHGGVERGAWRGMLDAAEVGAPLDLLMRTPAPLIVSFVELSLGPADFELRGTRFTAVEIVRVERRWRTGGFFAGLQPQVLDAQARAPRRVVRSGAGDRIPLTLAGRWQLEYVDAITGIAVIERTGGDIYSGIDGLNPIGVSDVGAALNVLDNRVTGNVYVRGRALGKVDAEIDAFIDPVAAGGRLLAQHRPFRVVVDATLPDLSWIGPLIGDSVQFNGSGTIKATIGGTPADPTASGSVRGQSLRLAWVDQGVRMENGTLDAVLEDGVLVINEWRFAGTPRVSPNDKRALEALATDRPFEVRAVGRIALSSLTGSIGITATQLPVLQRPDRWMVVTGAGGITLTPQAAELYAKVMVDSAYIDFSAQRAGRTLPADVTVVRQGEQRKPAEAPPLTVTLDLQANLGDRFYITGVGLEARLAGEVAVTGRTSQLRAEGSVRTVDGVYAGYGQRLKIERGIVTFQGPVDNPALNVLAIRSGLPVEVGVAIGGTALRPIVRLHSDPSMSDTEKLNWLVLGRPPGPSDGNDRALLSAAATALFSGQVDQASAGLMRSLGIDQITLQPGQSSGSLLPRETVAGRLRSSGSTAAADVVAVGKRINDDLYLSFEQALSGAEYFVALNYRLTRQLSLIARAGSTNALDLVYSLAFD
jgi:translocation and assembly module TamB